MIKTRSLGKIKPDFTGGVNAGPCSYCGKGQLKRKQVEDALLYEAISTKQKKALVSFIGASSVNEIYKVRANNDSASDSSGNDEGFSVKSSSKLNRIISLMGMTSRFKLYGDGDRIENLHMTCILDDLA